MANTSAFEAAFAAMPLGTVGAVVLGVVMISSEYAANAADAGAGRPITATLTAMPRRVSLLAAKVTVLVLLVIAVAAVTLPTTVGIANTVIGGAATETVTPEQAPLRGLGRALYWTLTGLIAAALALAGKTMAAAAVVGLGAALSVGAALATAVIAAAVTDVTLTAERAPWRLAGAIAYLAVIGLLAHAVAVALRHLVPALVAMIALLVIISPVAAGLTEHARWLPDRAASQLYADTDTLLTAATGPLVALAWLVAIGTAGAVGFICRDP
ncbi:ABC transporter permease [Occultella kanbiaonis]|uniref:ABC transporter permease n=1 Tax=Occultella kanbiaonis TaxID=2675754 RepID=UPI0013CF9D51|nr:ABC transporter permease [Occultella kanbiaonis]